MSYRSGQVIRQAAEGKLMQKAPAQLFSSGVVSWTTPESVLRRVRRVLKEIHLDPCSNQFSTVGAKVDYRLERGDDGLIQSWDYPTIYVNPPFGAGIVEWVRRCWSAHKQYGSDVVLLLPTWVEQPHWHDLVFPRADVACFIKGRVKYRIRGVIGESPPPMGTAMVLYSKKASMRKRFVEEFSQPVDQTDPSTGFVIELWKTR